MSFFLLPLDFHGDLQDGFQEVYHVLNILLKGNLLAPLINAIQPVRELLGTPCLNSHVLSSGCFLLPWDSGVSFLGLTLG